jgi:hypothetical protein
MTKVETIAHICPALKYSSLLSIGQLCNHGCDAHFDANKVMIRNNAKTMLTGKRSLGAIDKIWILDLYLPPLEQREKETVNGYVNAALNHNNITNIIAFYHASLFYPVLSTWCDATVEGRLTMWSGLTSAQVCHHPPQSIAMHMGQLDQQRPNVRSTQPHPPTPTKIEPTPEYILDHQHDAASPILEPPAQKSHQIYVDCQESMGQIYTDRNGRFLQPSTSGNMMVCVAYEYNMNYLHAEYMQNKPGPQILAAYKRVHNMISARGLKPQLQKLDNEA